MIYLIICYQSIFSKIEIKNKIIVFTCLNLLSLYFRIVFEYVWPLITSFIIQAFLAVFSTVITTLIHYL